MSGGSRPGAGGTGSLPWWAGSGRTWSRIRGSEAVNHNLTTQQDKYNSNK